MNLVSVTLNMLSNFTIQVWTYQAFPTPSRRCRKKRWVEKAIFQFVGESIRYLSFVTTFFTHFLLTPFIRCEKY